MQGFRKSAKCRCFASPCLGIVVSPPNPLRLLFQEAFTEQVASMSLGQTLSRDKGMVCSVETGVDVASAYYMPPGKRTRRLVVCPTTTQSEMQSNRADPSKLLQCLRRQPQ